MGRQEWRIILFKGFFEQDGAAADHLTKICNRIAACAYSDDVRELLLIGLGVCLPKPDSDSLRPIVIGEALMRFIGSCTMNALKKKVTDYFGNLQLGVGVANGVETIVHAIRAMLELNPDLVLVCGDADNAFNNFTREQLFEEVRKHFPEPFLISNLFMVLLPKLPLRQAQPLLPTFNALWVSSKADLKDHSAIHLPCTLS